MRKLGLLFLGLFVPLTLFAADFADTDKTYFWDNAGSAQYYPTYNAVKVDLGANLVLTNSANLPSDTLVDADIGSSVQAYDAQLDDLSAIAPVKGTLLVYNATALTSLPVGTNDYVLTADSAEALGLKWAASTGGGREILTEDRTYFVEKTGSDSNNGLSELTAFLTMQKSLDESAAIDSSIYDVYIEVGAGTYSENLMVYPLLGAGDLVITGDRTTPANVVIAHPTGFGMDLRKPGTYVQIFGFRMTSTSGTHVITYSEIKLDDMEFGATTTDHILALQGGYIRSFGASVEFAGARYAVNAGYMGRIDFSTATITLDSTPAFSGAFTAALGQAGNAKFPSASFVGTATGTRYKVEQNGIVDTNGEAGTFLPGDGAGTTATQGQYL